MFDTVIHNARLYPMSGTTEQSDSTQIAIKDGKIQQLANEKSEGLLLAKQTIDANQACILPGFIDCHTHILYAQDRADEHAMRLQGHSYAEIHARGGGIQSSVRAVHAATEAQLIEQTKPRIQNLINEGVTTIEIKSGYGLDLDNEVKMLRAIKACRNLLPIDVISSFLGAHVVPKDIDKTTYIDQIIDQMLPKIAAADLAEFVDIFVENIAFDINDMQKLFAAAKKYNLKTRVHAEQLSNQSAAKTAAELQAYSADHLEYLDENGAQAMHENNTVAVLLPSAFYFLQEIQKPPLELLRKHNVKMAVATDCNPGTSPIPSLLTALHFAVHLFGLTPEEALLGVTLNSAHVLGLADTHGSLEIGKQANLCFWNINSPNMLCYQLGGIKPTHRMYKGVLEKL